jgi:Fe-S-cluster containining protein
VNDTGHSCKRCGKCCRFEIPVTILDIHRMAEHLGVSGFEVFHKYIQPEVSSRSSIFMIQKKDQRACLFLSDKAGCTIHPAKPRTCRFFSCSLTSCEEVMPWTATLSDQSDRAALWEHSIAVLITREYTKRHGAKWNETDYLKSVESILDNIVVRNTQKIKTSCGQDGTPIAMIFDCSICEKRGEVAKETPVTLDDIRRITESSNITWKEFFRDRIDSDISKDSGCYKLVRKKHCTFFQKERHCTITEVRPMHCRFTPCPLKSYDTEISEAFYLGSGTVEEQYRHQLALEITRQYIAQCGLVYNKHTVKKMLKNLERRAADVSELETFCNTIAPFRYVNDTLPILKKLSHHKT